MPDLHRQTSITRVSDATNLPQPRFLPRNTSTIFKKCGVLAPHPLFSRSAGPKSNFKKPKPVPEETPSPRRRRQTFDLSWVEKETLSRLKKLSGSELGGFLALMEDADSAAFLFPEDASHRKVLADVSASLRGTVGVRNQ